MNCFYAMSSCTLGELYISLSTAESDQEADAEGGRLHVKPKANRTAS